MISHPDDDSGETRTLPVWNTSHLPPVNVNLKIVNKQFTHLTVSLCMSEENLIVFVSLCCAFSVVLSLTTAACGS